MTSSKLLFLARLLPLFAFGVLCNGAYSGEVYKCKVDGSVVYQAQPCAGAGQPVRLDKGPSEEEIREAKNRAANDSMTSFQNGINRQQAAMREQYAAAAKRTPAAPNCDQLNSQVAKAQGDRTGMRKMGATMGVESGALLKMDEQNAAEINQRLNSATQAAKQAGCQ